MKNKFNVPMIVVIAVIVISSLYDELNNVNQPKSGDTASIKGNASERSALYAMRAADNTWPVISDNGNAMQVDDLTRKNYYLVLDGSGSMGDNNCSNGQSKIDVAKTAVVEFIKKIPDNANIGLVIFDGRGNFERTPLGSKNKNGAIHQIRQASSGGGTPLKSSIQHAYQSLSAQAIKQLGYGEYHLVVITDGEASQGEEPRYIVQDLLNHSPVVLHTIGFCIKGGHSLNQAGNTFYKSANNPEQLATGLESVLAEAPDFKADTFEGQAQ